jgi:hypothetical protein
VPCHTFHRSFATYLRQAESGLPRKHNGLNQPSMAYGGTISRSAPITNVALAVQVEQIYGAFFAETPRLATNVDFAGIFADARTT